MDAEPAPTLEQEILENNNTTAAEIYEKIIEEIRDSFSTQTVVEIKKNMIQKRNTGVLKTTDFISLITELQQHLDNKLIEKKYHLEVKDEVNKTITRQERTIRTGNGELAVKVNDAQNQAIHSTLDRAVSFLDRRLISTTDLHETITSQLHSPSIPYAVTGLTSDTIITGTISSQVKMRPNGVLLLEHFINDPEVMQIDYHKKIVHLKKFKKSIATMSYVQKDVPNNMGHGFYVKTIFADIEEHGDSFFLQSKRTYLEIENTTPQSMAFETVNRLMNKIAISVNPNFDDLTRHYHTKEPIYVKMTSTFDGSHRLSNKDKEHKINAFKNEFSFFFGTFDLITAELLFEEISETRNFLMETKSIISPEYNASLRQKFRNIYLPNCNCERRNVIIYGSGAINSALSTHILKNCKHCHIELVDPINDFCVDHEICNDTVFISNDKYENYEPLKEHYCLVVADIGVLAPDRNHFTNDYRYTNHSTTYLYEKFFDKSCKMVLKAGFAPNLANLLCDRIWHYKPHNPEFWIETSPTAKTNISTFMQDMLVEKLYFNSIRQKNWKKDKLVIGYSEEFPIYDAMDYLTTNLPFNINAGNHIPYSNSIHSKRLIPYSKPHLGFLTPEFTAKQKKFAADLESKKTVEEKLKMAEESDLLPQDKLYLVAHIMSKRIQVIGSRLKKGLGVSFGDKEAIKNEEMTLKNASYLISKSKYEGGFSRITTITPKISELCVDFDTIKHKVINRTSYNDYVSFDF